MSVSPVESDENRTSDAEAEKHPLVSWPVEVEADKRLAETEIITRIGAMEAVLSEKLQQLSSQVADSQSAIQERLGQIGQMPVGSRGCSVRGGLGGLGPSLGRAGTFGVDGSDQDDSRCSRVTSSRVASLYKAKHCPSDAATNLLTPMASVASMFSALHSKAHAPRKSTQGMDPRYASSSNLDEIDDEPAMGQQPTEVAIGSRAVSRKGKTRVGFSVCSPNSVVPSEQEISAAVTVIKKHERHPCIETFWQFLEYPDSSIAAWHFARFVTSFTVVSAMVPIMQTTSDPVIDRGQAAIVETSIEIFFTIEIFTRFVLSPNHLWFCISPFNVIDMLTIVPLLLRASIGFVLEAGDGNLTQSCLLYLVPIYRLLKVLRRFEKFRLIMTAFGTAYEALPVLLYVMALITMVYSTLLYQLEPRDNIETLPHAMWYVLVTMTTVGYGDISPVTAGGYLVSSSLVILSCLYMAMPLAMVGEAFKQVWEIRKEILMVQKARDHIIQSGYVAEDMAVLFRSFDVDNDGEIGVSDFMHLVEQMRIGLTDEEIMDLFLCFDKDGDGTISDQEFVRVLFPHNFLHLPETDEEASDDRPSSRGPRRGVSSARITTKAKTSTSSGAFNSKVMPIHDCRGNKGASQTKNGDA